MENKELERLQAGVLAYDTNRQKTKRRNRLIIIGILVVFIPIYLYLRLFNTHFETNLRYTDGIAIKYSTAWYVKVPSEYEGQAVKTLEGMNLYTRAPYIRYLSIEDGITDISGFSSNTLLGLRLPDTIQYISYAAFDGSSKLRWVSFPEKVDELLISDRAFWKTSITEADLPEGTTYVGDFAFGGCTSLKSASLPDTVTFEGDGVFSGCTNLESVKLSNQCTELGIYFFSDCKKLTDVTWPDNLQCISPDAMRGSALNKLSIEELNLPDSVYFATTHYGASQAEIFHDINKENLYLSQKTGIPVEVFEESMESNNLWIDGTWYSLPMRFSDFTRKDDWVIVEKDNKKAVLEHAESKTQLELGLDDDFIYSCFTNDPDCVFPGGLICQSAKCYRACENDKSNYGSLTDDFEYHWGPGDKYFIKGYVEPDREIIRSLYFKVNH